MASTKKEEKASKKYYDSHKKYRQEKIRKQIAKQKANKDEENEYHREYYRKSEKYREYKRKYSKRYHKLEPVKSLARKDRKAVKKK
jgi:hypothetical protein